MRLHWQLRWTRHHQEQWLAGWRRYHRQQDQKLDQQVGVRVQLVGQRKSLGQQLKQLNKITNKNNNKMRALMGYTTITSKTQSCSKCVTWEGQNVVSSIGTATRNNSSSNASHSCRLLISHVHCGTATAVAANAAIIRSATVMVTF